MTNQDYAPLAAARLKELLGDRKPKTFFILGSGLTAFSDLLRDPIVISYADIPGYPAVGVGGHIAELVCGYLGEEVVCSLKGRVHFYEGDQRAALKTMIRSLKLIGCERLVTTAAVGSLNYNIAPGSLVMISDHINMLGLNPLSGRNDDTYGPRFVPMGNAYHPELRQAFMGAADTINLPLKEGVYVSVLGPSFETEAEIKMLRGMGADVVGMSVVPDTLIARHCGLDVVGFAVVVNYGTGMVPGEEISHDRTLEDAQLGRQVFEKLMCAYYKHDIKQ